MQTDVIIIGGGVVGFTLARGLLNDTPYSVTLVDANPVPDNNETPHSGFDARIIALARRSADALSAYGINLGDAGATAIRHIEVSDQGRVGLCQLHADEHHLPAFGEVVSIRLLGQALFAAVKDNPAFTYVAPASVVDAVTTNDAATLTLDNDDALTSRLLVLADGGRSALGASLGFTRSVKSYGQTAIVCNIHCSEPLSGRAYERFTPEGPLAVLPFDSEINGQMTPGHGGSVVWTLETHNADKIMSLSDSAFIHALQDTFGYRQGRIIRVTPRLTYPLALASNTRVDGLRCVVVGNAAQTLHPIAGQGFNLGLRDCLSLIALLKQQPADAGQITREYARVRRDDRQMTIGLTDTLVHVFANRHLPLVMARNGGLLGLELIPGIKDAFVRQTTGFGAGTTTNRTHDATG
ncbi:2-octaprenyl-6-methoxyphenyl hydroxylase [Alteromonas sp. CYL-A6]|uniref:2-octaprenyl-6-methoxyphenyl hydroxylase n=1 Tax=Alteromonas nitratireducens TaxID=3390813 RepID=UPI0034A9AEB7